MLCKASKEIKGDRGVRDFGKKEEEQTQTTTKI